MWQPIETAPKDQFLLLCGPSGYTTTPMVVTTGCMCSDYHAGRWIDHANDDLTDWGFTPTHWAPLILPGAQPAQRMNMQTADQITQAFKAELQALLDKYGADLSARDTWEGYPECGEDVRMHVNVPSIYDADHNCLREYTEIDLGSWVSSTQAMPKEAKP